MADPAGGWLGLGVVVMDRGQAILVTEKIAAGFAAVAIALEKGAQALERGEPPAAVAHYLRFLAKEVQSVVDVV